MPRPIRLGGSRAPSPAARDALAIYRAGVAAVDPGHLVAARLGCDGDSLLVQLRGRALRRRVDRVWVAAAGKAAVAMARAVARIAPRVEGIAIAPVPRRGAPRPARVGRIHILYGEHPIPGRGSFAATRELLAALARRPREDSVLLLLSGGASALLASPADGVSSRDKVAMNRLLVGAGLEIHDLNAVRKHVSRVKGGGLLRAASPREVLTLALSDVAGDDLATIGSGPGAADPTTYADALAAVDRHGLRRALPTAVRERLEAGARGAGAPAARPSDAPTERPSDAPAETVKPGDPVLRRVRGAIVGSNATARRAAAAEARRRGYAVEVRARLIRGEAQREAHAFVRALPRAGAGARCVIAGGEPVVDARAARGRGGRCQELVLAAVPLLAGGRWMLLAAGTDGRDGATPAAGATCDGATLGRSGARAVEDALEAHDSHGFFSRHGGLVVTGPSGTNAMDLVVAVARPAAARPRRGGRSRRGVIRD